MQTTNLQFIDYCDQHRFILTSLERMLISANTQSGQSRSPQNLNLCNMQNIFLQTSWETKSRWSSILKKFWSNTQQHLNKHALINCKMKDGFVSVKSFQCITRSKNILNGKWKLTFLSIHKSLRNEYWLLIKIIRFVENDIIHSKNV